MEKQSIVLRLVIPDTLPELLHHLEILRDSLDDWEDMKWSSPTGELRLVLETAPVTEQIE